MMAIARRAALALSLLAGGLLTLAAPAATAADTPCSNAARLAGWTEPSVEGHADLDALVRHLATRQVVYVGEVHDRLEHHLTQLEIICRLRGHGPLAVGLEYFQVPAQRALDAYVETHGDLQRLLREGEWFSRWRYDPRLYAPILRFARQHRIPLIALNVPGELVRKAGREGFSSLDRDERARLPASIERGPRRYVERIREVFDAHPEMGGRFEDFLSAQLLWDEGMAQRGAEQLLAHPRTRLVVLAGEGHVINGDGIPDRLARRVPGPRSIVVQSDAPIDSAPEDHVRVVNGELPLPPPGRLGVHLAAAAEGLRIERFADVSAARDAGLAVGDRLLAVNGRRLRGLADIRLALWDAAPGTPVTLKIARGTGDDSLVMTLR